MRKNEFTFDEALTHVQSCRSIVSPNSSFIKQLSEYNPLVDTKNDNYNHDSNSISSNNEKGTKRSLETTDDNTPCGPPDSIGPSLPDSVIKASDTDNNEIVDIKTNSLEAIIKEDDSKKRKLE